MGLAALPRNGMPPCTFEQVIIMGDGSVGKTSLVMRFTKDYFSTTYKQTIGLDFYMKRLELPGER